MIPVSVTERLSKFSPRYNGYLQALALVDGLQYQQHTGQILEAEPGVASSLFAGTKDIALAHAGPWLIDPKKARDRIADLGELEQVRPGVIWLISTRDIETQAAKLRPHLSVRLPKSKAAMLRFWDPRVLHTLNRMFQSKQARELFAAAFEWQYLREGQRLYINDHAPTE